MGQDKEFQNIWWGLIMVAMATVTAEDPLFTCDFETDDLCGMEQWKNDNFDWTRHSNRTPSDIDNKDKSTGPREARLGTYYIYIETSNPINKDDRAYISTPAIQHSGDICVRFYYNMYGDHIGRLVVFKQSESNAVWTEEGDNGSPWFDGNVTVKNLTENDKVVFLGQAGNGRSGDIAIDYVRIHAGECSDNDECREGKGGCSDQCLNTMGSYHCQCPTGYSLAADNWTCEDIDECATDAGNECDHVCINVEGSYNCSCRDTYIRATDGHHCIECYFAYKPKVKSSQLFTSECPTIASHTDITLADCLQEACRSQAGVVAYFNMVCDLKQCDGGNIQLKIVSGSSGWDIYMLNTTWSAATNDGNQGNLRSGDDFPLVPVVVGVLVPVTLLVAIVIVVVLLRRRRQTREGSESVHYENDPGRNITDREHDNTSPPITEVHSSAGIYEEVAEPDNKQQVPRNETYDDVTGDPVSRISQVKEAAPNDASEGSTYMNAAFQGDCRYQGLGPDGNPRHYDTIE